MYSPWLPRVNWQEIFMRNLLLFFLAPRCPLYTRCRLIISRVTSVGMVAHTHTSSSWSSCPAADRRCVCLQACLHIDLGAMPLGQLLRAFMFHLRLSFFKLTCLSSQTYSVNTQQSVRKSSSLRRCKLFSTSGVVFYLAAIQILKMWIQWTLLTHFQSEKKSSALTCVSHDWKSSS